MDEPLNSLPPGLPQEDLPMAGAPVATAAMLQPARARLLRRMAVLLAATALTFTATIWVLVRLDPSRATVARIAAPKAVPSSMQATGPESVVRAQLDAFRRGQVREAYDLFSEHYRTEVSFEAFHDLVASHWRMLRAKTVQFESREATGARMVLDTHIVSVDDEHYLARYTLVASQGRWWIDDVRWGLEPDAPRQMAGSLRRALLS